jgi:CheY-like chemotaxis protein
MDSHCLAFIHMSAQMCPDSNDSSTLFAFRRLLADYRARVHETFLFDNKPVSNLMSLFAEDGADEPASTILVIEDNADQWFLTRWALLQLYPRAKSIWLSSDSEVLPYLDACWQDKKEPWLILLDLYLPSAQQGLNVLQKLKAHPRFAATAVIVLSWSNQIEDITQAFTHAADGYLVKPISYQDWLTELRLLDSYRKKSAKY